MFPEKWSFKNCSLGDLIQVLSWRQQKHRCLCFHYWDYLTNFWRNDWQSIFDIVGRLCLRMLCQKWIHLTVIIHLFCFFLKHNNWRTPQRYWDNPLLNSFTKEQIPKSYLINACFSNIKVRNSKHVNDYPTAHQSVI